MRDGRTWRLEAYFADEPDEDYIRALIRPVIGDAADAAEFRTIAQQDWVRASLEGLKPVRAGRFVVHGAHDRDTVRANDLPIEIEAALAFGTGHRDDAGLPGARLRAEAPASGPCPGRRHRHRHPRLRGRQGPAAAGGGGRSRR